MAIIAENLKNIIPFFLKNQIKKIFYWGNKYYCNVCDSNLRKFLPAGVSNSVINELEIIGAGYHTNDVCPICNASYRTRSIVAFWESTDIDFSGKRILHIAPEQGLYEYIKKNNPENYICGDIDPKRYSQINNIVYIDLSDITFQTESFDLIICNHVLEHIPDDKKAMSELYRILSVKGKAILQVPISFKLQDTLEDPSCNTPEKRFQKFGQHDHVRIYAMKDYIKRLEKTGFSVSVMNVKDFNLIKKYKKLALDERENIFICDKF